MELLEQQRTKREAAAGANSVMEPIAKRKLRKELQKVRAGHLRFLQDSKCTEMSCAECRPESPESVLILDPKRVDCSCREPH